MPPENTVPKTLPAQLNAGYTESSSTSTDPEGITFADEPVITEYLSQPEDHSNYRVW